MRCTVGEVDMMEVPLTLHESATPRPPLPGYSHPTHAAHDDDSAAPPSPTPGVNPGCLGPLFQQGFVDCAQEAVRFLMEEEGLAADDPLVMGLKHHLLLNAAPRFGVPSQGYPPAMAAPHPAVWSSGAPHRVGGKHAQSQDIRGTKNEQCTSPVLTELLPISHSVRSASSTTSSASEGLLTESDLAGVLSCLTYIHPGPARAYHELQHACHQMELLPARGRELSFTSSESDADSSLNVTSVSDGDISVTHDFDMAVADSDSVFVSCQNEEDSATGAADSGAITDLAAESTNAHTNVSVSSEDQSVSDCNASTVALPPSSSSQTSTPTPTALEIEETLNTTTSTFSQTTTMEALPTSHAVPPASAVPIVSLFPSFLAAPGVGLSPEEVRIRTLAHEILALLHEEALDESDVEDDDIIDDAYDFEDEAEDMVIEIEQ